jgi:hypothetical protein
VDGQLGYDKWPLLQNEANDSVGPSMSTTHMNLRRPRALSRNDSALEGECIVVNHDLKVFLFSS